MTRGSAAAAAAPGSAGGKATLSCGGACSSALPVAPAPVACFGQG